ncbi:AAA domain-containing protein [Nitrogeniibacter mangrovi]|uniref:AAA domain-containing protein n=1 Tax=Nitrogeniibacter mangrovi TaxID=2016596 RepID=A0A6C1B293_9RHOO|nr:sigma 54-interacting transcriptional regulator [Nitrogeniibacter mangrovi]QID17493.1 AAA domain-containing protein [Nitrogeniibacter mangrovi]
MMPTPPDCALGRLASGDPRVRRAIDRAHCILDKPIPLLIQGESGVGKEMFAQAFHRSGTRADKPFVALNCAAIPEHLIESELFGYLGGAFTGARKEGSMGKIVQACGGTLFLDEIGDMPLSLQVRLLRVLQERVVVPLGSVQTIPVEFSLICATHHHLQDAVAHHRFREDLYFRINGLTVTLPPLRERCDVLDLAHAMLKTSAPERELSLTPEVCDLFLRHPWPGNLRQLNNAIRVAVALLEPEETRICLMHLPEELLETDDVMPISAAPAASAQSSDLKSMTLSAIDHALASTGGNVSAAARLLGISRNTLYRRMNAAPVDSRRR